MGGRPRAEDDVLVGILSDSHGDAEATARAVSLLESQGATAFFHCGDICGERVLDVLAGRKAYFVWGNCDDPSPQLHAYVQALELPWPAPSKRISLGGKRIAMYHGHEREFPDALKDPKLDYVFFGHSHRREDSRDGGPRAINPGALFRAAVKTVALLDLKRDELTFLDLEGRPVR